MKKAKNIGLFFVMVFLFVVFVCTFFAFFSKISFLADICSQFRFQYFLFSFIALIVFYIARTDKKLVYIAFVTFLINAVCVLNCLRFPDFVNHHDISIGVINLLSSNNKYEKVRDELLKKDVDILVIEEINDKWSLELQEVKSDYPFIYELSRDDNFGIAFYSKIPIKAFQKVNAGPFDVPAIMALCDFDGHEFEFIAVHTTPPINSEYFRNTSKMFKNIAQYVEKSERDVIVAGDVNTTAFSYNYQNFVKQSDLKDSGNILKTTWSAKHFPFMRITLDHIFVPKTYKVKDFEVGKNVGSDHFPIYAKISFENQ